MALRQMAVRVDDERVASDDVTQEYVDLQARLRAQEAAESRYLALMERAQNVNDVVTVQRELTSVRATIEQIKGRIQYLERSSAMSLITIRLTPKANPQPLADPGWSPNEQVREAVRTLVDLGQYLATVGIWIAVFSPLWLPVALAVLWLSRRSRNSGKVGSPVAQEPKV